MRVNLKLFAMLQDLLPPGTPDHTLPLDLEEGTTARQVIERMRIPKEMAHLVMIDGTHLLPQEINERPLQEGDTLAIFPPIAGG
jgi:molybdopterin converting factor small subunit